MTDKITFYVDNDETRDTIKYFWGGVYFHGDLEETVGFDIARSNTNKDDIQDGIHEVIVDNDHECKLFLWSNPVNGYREEDGKLIPITKETRGLIVKITDTDSLTYAEKCYLTKRAYL